MSSTVIQGQSGIVLELSQLNARFEEADQRMIPHIHWSVSAKSIANVVVVSNDTDVLVLLVHYFSRFKNAGLKKAWLKTGRGDQKRFVAVHLLTEQLGVDKCAVLLKAHL